MCFILKSDKRKLLTFSRFYAMSFYKPITSKILPCGRNSYCWILATKFRLSEKWDLQRLSYTTRSHAWLNYSSLRPGKLKWSIKYCVFLIQKNELRIQKASIKSHSMRKRNKSSLDCYKCFLMWKSPVFVMHAKRGEKPLMRKVTSRTIHINLFRLKHIPV